MYYYYFVHAGARLWPDPPEYLDTAADAIRLQQLGHLTFDILSQLAEKEVFEMVCRLMICLIWSSACESIFFPTLCLSPLWGTVAVSG